MPSLNRVILLGTIGSHGVEVHYTDKGTAHTNFMLVLTEAGTDGKAYTTWIPCEIWGKGAERAGELEPGQTVAIEGKLRRVKKGEQWDSIVSGFDVTKVV